MDRATFEEHLRRDGFTPVYGGRPPGYANDGHAHDFTVRLLILGGELTLRRNGQAETLRQGDWCEVAAGAAHAEQAGPEGVAFLSGRLHSPF